jgi:hypothetical protein
MRSVEKRAKAAGEKVPEWVIKSKTTFKVYHERFKEKERLWFLISMLVIGLLMLMASWPF